jgi:hypothetical protein
MNWAWLFRRGRAVALAAVAVIAFAAQLLDGTSE